MYLQLLLAMLFRLHVHSSNEQSESEQDLEEPESLYRLMSKNILFKEISTR